MCKLYVGTADNLYLVYDLISLLLETGLCFFTDGKHGSRTEGVTGMYAHGIDVLDEADCDHLSLCITDNFKLKLFPAHDGLFYKYLAYQGRLDTALTYELQLFCVVNKSAAGTAHGVCRTEYYGVAELVCYRKCLIYRVSYFASCHLDTELVHRVLKFYSILASFDGIKLYAYNLYAVLVKYACFSELGA